MASQAKKKITRKKPVTKKSVKKSPRTKSSPAKKSASKIVQKKATKNNVAKKKTTKKRATKRTQTSTQASRVRRNAPADQMFIMVDGKRIKNIKELADVMGEIEDYVFNHHVNEHNNDFENWLKHVFEEIALAREIAGCKDKKHVQLVLYKHISHKLW